MQVRPCNPAKCFLTVGSLISYKGKKDRLFMTALCRNKKLCAEYFDVFGLVQNKATVEALLFQLSEQLS